MGQVGRKRREEEIKEEALGLDASWEERAENARTRRRCWEKLDLRKWEQEIKEATLAPEDRDGPERKEGAFHAQGFQQLVFACPTQVMESCQTVANGM